MLLKIHHIGCLVEDIEVAKKTYETLGFDKPSDTILVSSQNVKVSFVSLRNDTFLELIEPLKEAEENFQKLKNKNVAYYHIGYLVKNIEQEIATLIEKGFFFVESFNSEAFENRKCAFLYSREMHLIELIEEL